MAASGEESKDATEDQKTKIAAKVGKIVDSLTVKKAAPRAGGFRSFMKTAKTELKEMQLVEKPEQSSAAASSEENVIKPAFAATVAVPKKSQNSNLIGMNLTVEPPQMAGDTALSPEQSPAASFEDIIQV